MQEPVPGISAVPDEHNARYFHVVVAGPQEVIQALEMLCLVCVCFFANSFLFQIFFKFF